MKKKWASILLAGALFLGVSDNVYGAEQKVTVTIPTFQVELQQEQYNNLQADYPLVVYRDVTYFPLTYNLTRQMNLITGWDNEKGFFVSQYYGEESYAKDGLSKKNKPGGSYKATLPEYPITINGIAIDNKKEEYPLLNFRGVTYFPMTWGYIHDEFGWEIVWDDEKGLSVRTSDLSNTEGKLFVTDIGKKYVLLQQGEFGSVPNYSLDCEKNEVAVLMPTDGRDYWLDPAEGSSIYEQVKLDKNQVKYKGKVLKDVSAWEDVQIAEATLFEFEDCSFVGLYLNYDMDTPAPYTPRIYSVIQIKNGKVTEIGAWDDRDALIKVYETKDAYYLGSEWRWMGGRWSNNLATTVKVDKKTNQATVLNELWEDYKSVELLGVGKGKVYLRNTYFGNETNVGGKGEVSAVNDGYFYLDDAMKLHKIYGFIDGEAFVGTNGELFVIDPNVVRITNVSDGVRIEW